jgi:hypothetical protein
VFISLDLSSLKGWEARSEIAKYGDDLAGAQREWFAARDMEAGIPRVPRFVLVHSFAHLLIRRFELEAGYSGSSLRERIYCDNEMAGFLVYTATPDSEGTLGGLVELARPEDLGPMLARALDEARLCANDPFCASRTPSDRDSHLNGASCHACLLLPETSCEAGNHFLDRSLLVQTLNWSEGFDLAFVSD